jgi:hypothetical protein
MAAGDLSNTPLNYATPEQIAAANQLADLLTQQSSSNKRIMSPWEGLAQMTQAFVGGRLAALAANSAQGGRDVAAQEASKRANWYTTGAGMPTPSPAAANPSAVPASQGWNPAWGSPSPAPSTGVAAQPWAPVPFQPRGIFATPNSAYAPYAGGAGYPG